MVFANLFIKMQSSVIITYLVEERNKNESKPLYFMVCHGCMVANIPAVVAPSRCYCCGDSLSSPTGVPPAFGSPQEIHLSMY